MRGGVEAEAGAGLGEQPAHGAGGGRRNHILSISSYFCNSIFLKIPIYITMKYILFNVLGFYLTTHHGFTIHT